MTDVATGAFYTARIGDIDEQRALVDGAPEMRLLRDSVRGNRRVREWWSIARLARTEGDIVATYRYDGYDYDTQDLYG